MVPYNNGKSFIWRAQMRVKHFDLPESLIEAQEAGTLVVFAGAGVSMGSPSNLPSFSQLAKKIAAGALEKKKDEPIDQFLGRLADLGIQVHSVAFDILNNPKSKPTELHRALLALFMNSEKLRVVTTNFDRHFSSLETEIFPSMVERYYAPALPIGSKFSGLVYLHGSVEKKKEDLILTDMDFGRAYLTEGWATRFLKDMFEEFVVLFVGYSHDDPIMSYLSRALVPGKTRFALTLPGNDTRWRFLGIEPIHYPRAKGANKHKMLFDSLVAWLNLVKMGALDHERRIREIVISSPPRDQETIDYMKECLGKLSTLRFFTRYARSPEWLKWMEDVGSLDPLFQSNDNTDQASNELANWVAGNFVCEYPEEVLALIQRQGQNISGLLWHRIAIELMRRDPLPEPDLFSRWIAMLLDTVPRFRQPLILSSLLKSLRYPEDKTTAILLWEYLTKPRIKLNPSYRTSFSDNIKVSLVEPEILIEGEDYWLRKSWEKYFKPNLPDFYNKLEPILTKNLMHANLLLSSMKRADNGWDPISFGRTSIEPHSQDSHPRTVDMLINAARDIIEWMLSNKQRLAGSLIEEWGNTSIPILRRLAIHGMAESSYKSDKKIDWILQKNWLYTYGLRHEVFRLLKIAYPKSSRKIRVRLLEKINKNPTLKRYSKETREHAKFKLIAWLNNADKKCSLAAEYLRKIQSKHPEFKLGEHPDLDVFVSIGWRGAQSPLSVEQLLKQDPRREIDWLLGYKEDQPLGPNREGLLNNIVEAVKQSFEYSWKLVLAFQKKNNWISDLWVSVIMGWQGSTLSEDNWLKILTFLNNNAHKLTNFNQIADLIERGTRKEAGKLPLSCLSLAENLAMRLYRRSVRKRDKERKLIEHDWLTVAINHSGGTIAEFLLNALSLRRTEAKVDWKGIPLQYKRFFRSILTGTSFAAQMGRIILASQVHFLFWLDVNWTQKNILPLLDWKKDPIQAVQAWDGYLSWGHWDDSILPHLLPFYIQTIPKLSKEISAYGERFCEHLAEIALFSSINPIKQGWLQKFLGGVDSKYRVDWARFVGYRLESLKIDSAKTVWNRWIKAYWEKRVKGIPIPLDDEEKSQMIMWAASLDPVFPEVVKVICSSTAPDLKQTRFYNQFLEKGNFKNYPSESARLLKHLLLSASDPFYHCNEVEELTRGLIESEANKVDLLVVCDNLARLGCGKAEQLKEIIERRVPNQPDS